MRQRMPTVRKKEMSVSEDLKDYIFALGKFIHLYSAVERMWHEAFRSISRIPISVARAMVGSARGGDLVAMTRRVAKVKKMNKRNLEELENLSVQFHAIAEFRDRLIHRNSEIREKIIYSTNKSSAKSKEDFEYIEFTIDDLQRASMDLASIEFRLTLFVPRLAVAAIPHSHDWFFEPWRYKRLELKTPYRSQTKSTKSGSSQRNALIKNAKIKK